MFSVLDTLVDQAQVCTRREAFDVLDWVFQSEITTPIDKIKALYAAMQVAETEDQWRIISAYLQTNFRLLGRVGMSDQVMFNRCDLSVLRDLLHGESGIIAEMVKTTADPIVDSVGIRCIHLAFDGLLAVWNRSGLEEDKTRLEQFILAVQGIFRAKNNGRVPKSIWTKFYNLRHAW